MQIFEQNAENYYLNVAKLCLALILDADAETLNAANFENGKKVLKISI